MLDTTFLIDLLDNDDQAKRKAQAFKAAGERPRVPAPALAEVMIGANYLGGAYLRKTLEMLSVMEVLAPDESAGAEAGRLGAEALRRGAPVPTLDLLIAATTLVHGGVLLTRDSAFSTIPGLPVETY